MKQTEAVLSLSFILWFGSSAVAQEAVFSLDEVEGKVAQESSKKAPNEGPQQVIEQALGARRWGMSRAELLEVLKAEIQAQFEQRIKIERDIMRQDALYQQAQERYRRIFETYVQFDGIKTGWDVSPIASEFVQGNGEAMLVVQDDKARDLYFFMRGKLWKWYREFSALPVGTSAAESTVKSLGERLGRGKPQKERLDDSKVAHPGVTWSAASTRVTVLSRGRETCLVMEDTHVVDRLAVLRRTARMREARVHSANELDWVLLQGDAQARQ